jgi:hypothetical protein
MPRKDKKCDIEITPSPLAPHNDRRAIPLENPNDKSNPNTPPAEPWPAYAKASAKASGQVKCQSYS